MAVGALLFCSLDAYTQTKPNIVFLLADVESLDDSVGRLLKRLDELGLRENTQ